MIAAVSRVPKSIRERIFDCQTEDDWDDEGATGITASACEAAVRFLETTLERYAALPAPKVSPSVYGAVTMYWSRNRSHFLVRPSPDLDLAYYQQENLGSDSAHGDETKEQVVNRILMFFNATYAEQS